MPEPNPADDLPRDPDDEQRETVERQGNIVFWITLSVAVLILVVSAVYAIVL
jgi:hypothetical protein